MELVKVDQPQYSPKCCLVCRTHEGPFVEVPNIRWTGVPTIEGPIQLQVSLAFCLGPDDEHPGCVFRLARFAGCLLPGEKDAWQQLIGELTRQRDQQAAKIADLRAGLDAAKSLIGHGAPAEV